jgi:RNA polymerase sigma-70 factor (ECF subfamily)
MPLAMLNLFSLTSDQGLVRRTVREDPRSGEELVFRYQRNARAIVRSMGISTDKLDDVVQESFLKAFSELSLERPGTFGAWFLISIRNTAWNNLRALGRTRFSNFAVEPPDGREEPEEMADCEEDIWRKVADLPEGHMLILSI